jgi:hypothetical protein
MMHKKRTLVENKPTTETRVQIVPSRPQEVIPSQPDEYFTDAKFHIGYVDVINAFNNLAPNQRQIFNINNVPCEVTTTYDQKEITEMLSNFVESVNKDIQMNVMSVHNVSSGWDEQVFEPTVKSGWDKTQESLGLPASLYQKPAIRTKVHLVSFSHVVKYETENEIKYDARMVLSKEKIKDKLVIKGSFVIVKGILGNEARVLVEMIDILGFLSSQGMGEDRIDLDNYYYFDSLEKNNMLSGKMIEQELMKKYDTRRKVMQERIEHSDCDVIEKYVQSPSPAEYESYQTTRTILDDMKTEPTYD